MSNHQEQKEHSKNLAQTISASYTCPMHPGIYSNSPGMCRECGMNLVPTKEKSSGKHGSHRKDNSQHAGHSAAQLYRKFWISLLLTIPVLLNADIVRKIFNWSFPAFTGSSYLSIILGSIVFFYGGSLFLTGAWREIKGRLPGMMTLIGIAISSAYLWSVYAVFAGQEALFWELTSLITIMLLGHWLEMRAVSGAQGALKELSMLLPDMAEVIRGDKTEKIALSELKENDIVLIRAGAKIPADGEIANGESNVNESMITGESKPVSKKQGGAVIAGTINGEGVLKVKVINIGKKTFLAGIMRLVAEAQASKSKLQILSDRAALYLTVVAVTGGVITLIAWLVAGAAVGFAVARLVAVLVIACPHALGLAVPLIASISTTKAAENGFLVKQRLALEAARSVDIVLFDKTGTLTKGEFGVIDIWNSSEFKKNQVLELAASVNSLSEHPVAKAIVKQAKQQNLVLREPKNFKVVKGKGVTALLDGKDIIVGGPAIIESNNLVVPKDISKLVESANEKGQTTIYVFVNFQFVGGFALADVIRDESREAIKALKEIGVITSIITGDANKVAAWVSKELGVDEYFARVLPDQKSGKVKELQTRGLKVAMVGDGINDAPALTQADLGIAIGAGTNVAIESAGIILVRDDPRDIVKIIKLSRLTYAKMMQNLFWATSYNIVALPLAAGALAFKGILLEPALAAVFMSASTVIVAVNAIFLKRKLL